MENYENIESNLNIKQKKIENYFLVNPGITPGH